MQKYPLSAANKITHLHWGNPKRHFFRAIPSPETSPSVACGNV